MILYEPDASFFNQRNLPDIKDPYICKFTQSSAMQWLLNMYTDYTISYDPFVKDLEQLVPNEIYGTIVSTIISG